MLKRLCLIALFSHSTLLWAASTTPTPNGEKNYSGSYNCKGSNSKVGDYAYTLTLKLNKSHNHDEVSVYDVSGETENSTMYSGNAVAIGNRMSIAFRVSDHKDNIFGSGFAVFKSGPEKLWTFTTHYYEPSETGGAAGTDVCTQNAPPPVPKKVPEDAAPKKPVEESSNKKPAEEPAAKKPTDESAGKKISPDDSVTKKPAEETAVKKPADDASSKKAPTEPAPKKPAEEAARN